VDGIQTICPGEVTYTCTVTEAISISWTAAPILTDITLVRFLPTTPPNERMRSCSDASSTVRCTDLDYRASLTNVGTVDMNGLADLTSTFRFTARAGLSGTVVQCSSTTLTGTQTDDRVLNFTGKYTSSLVCGLGKYYVAEVNGS